MQKGIRYKRLETGSYAQEDKPDSVANLLHRRSQTLTYFVKDWTLVDQIAGYDQSAERESFSFYNDITAGSRLNCHLVNEDRRLWTLREEGVQPIEADFELDIRPIDNSEIEGEVRHNPPDDTDDEFAHSEQLHAFLGIPRERFNWIVAQLRQPDACLHVTLSIPLYKEEIALAFDRHHYTQHLALPYNEATPIRAYTLSVSRGPGLLRMLQAQPDAEPDDDAEPVVAAPAVTRSVAPEADKRLTYIVALLGALVVILLLR